jgi:predicted transcriptional regulator
MKYLLIDFGASYIKSTLYKTENNNFSKYLVIESPLKTCNQIQKQTIIKHLENIISQYDNIDSIAICSILGGKYIDDVYYSWKCSNIEGVKNKESCIIKDIFVDPINNNIIGKILNINVITPFIDTQCVIKSAELLPNKNILINMGTGSQVVYKDEYNELHIHSYIPSGRSLNVFSKFFNQINIDFFSYINRLSLQDIIRSDLDIDLNCFPQSDKYTDGGSVSKINETNFTIKNFIGSIIKNYLIQYESLLISPNNSNILLSGGIPKKLPIIEKYFSYRYPNSNVQLISKNIDETLIGLSKFITEK